MRKMKGVEMRKLERTADLIEKTLREAFNPQVAALGSAHWRVEKRVEDDKTLSTVVALMPEERVDEIARMLAGDVVTDEARGAARSLLAAL